jgi:Family of unknown function (DUF6502)
MSPTNPEFTHDTKDGPSRLLRAPFAMACYRLLLPLARALLRHGVTAHEFGRMADAAFVTAASDVLREQGYDPNFSRISTLTGMHRHAVSAMTMATKSDKGEKTVSKQYQRNRLARVLTGWFDNPEYTDTEGKPRVLPFDGPVPSFTTLVRRYSGDIYARIILDELLRVKAARMTRDGMVRAVSRRFASAGADAESLQHMGEAARDLMATLEHNLSAEPDDTYFVESVAAVNLPPDVIPLLRQLIARRGASFLEDIDGWLTQHERSLREVAKGQPTVRAGVSVHMFVETPRNLAAEAGPDETPSSDD